MLSLFTAGEIELPRSEWQRMRPIRGRPGHIASIAFPAISTGALGYPVKPATRIAPKTGLVDASRFARVKYIRFMLFSAVDARVYAEILTKYAERIFDDR